MDIWTLWRWVSVRHANESLEINSGSDISTAIRMDHRNKGYFLFIHHFEFNNHLIINSIFISQLVFCSFYLPSPQMPLALVPLQLPGNQCYIKGDLLYFSLFSITHIFSKCWFPHRNIAKV